RGRAAIPYRRSEESARNDTDAGQAAVNGDRIRRARSNHRQVERRSAFERSEQRGAIGFVKKGDPETSPSAGGRGGEPGAGRCSSGAVARRGPRADGLEAAVSV